MTSPPTNRVSAAASPAARPETDTPAGPTAIRLTNNTAMIASLGHYSLIPVHHGEPSRRTMASGCFVQIRNEICRNRDRNAVAGIRLLDQVAAEHPGIREVWVDVGYRHHPPSTPPPSASTWRSPPAPLRDQGIRPDPEAVGGGRWSGPTGG